MTLKFRILLTIMLHSLRVSKIHSYSCVAGYWGHRCGNLCGHCMGGGEFCHVLDGSCFNGCASGYKGAKCKVKCSKGTYGPYCLETCGNCSIPDNCHHETGHCQQGCQVGFQPPLCKTPCEHLRWGRNCANHCEDCHEDCWCNATTGQCMDKLCTPLSKAQHKYVRYYRDKSPRECINHYALKKIIAKYTPPSVLDIPWWSILSLLGTLFSFVLGNFLWWWFMVRQPGGAEEVPAVDRSVKPDYMEQNQDDQHIILSRMRKKVGDLLLTDLPKPVLKRKTQVFRSSLRVPELSFGATSLQSSSPNSSKRALAVSTMKRRQSAVDPNRFKRKQSAVFSKAFSQNRSSSGETDDDSD